MPIILNGVFINQDDPIEEAEKNKPLSSVYVAFNYKLPQDIIDKIRQYRYVIIRD